MQSSGTIYTIFVIEGLRLSRFRSYSVADIWAKAQTLVPSSAARLLFSNDDKVKKLEINEF